MKLTSQQYAQALYDSIVETAPKDHDKVMDNFVKILAGNGDLGKYEEIELEYKRVEREAKGIKEAQVTVAHDVEMNSGIIEQLNKLAGSKLEIHKKVDDRIVGGVVVRVDDTLIDASIKGQLNNLNKELKS